MATKEAVKIIYMYIFLYGFGGIMLQDPLLDEVMEQKIKTIIVTHKDRFIRFGYDWFEKFCTKFNTTIVVVNNEKLSPQEELVQDVV